MDLKIIITSYKEPQTIKNQVKNLREIGEVYVVAPDEETGKAGEKEGAIWIRDKGEGKPSALNLVFEKLKGDYFLLTDGDVLVDKDTVKYLLNHFKDEKVGIVTGRVVPIENKNKLLNYWSKWLLDVAHLEKLKKKELFATGYLYVIRGDLAKKIKLPKNALADDGYISEWIKSNGYKIVYEPRSIVYVKYPENLRDWVRQKVRTILGHKQLSYWFKKSERNFFKELRGIKYIKWSKIHYLIPLFIMRLFVWFKAHLKKPDLKVWKRVESTKSN